MPAFTSDLTINLTILMETAAQEDPSAELTTSFRMALRDLRKEPPQVESAWHRLIQDLDKFYVYPELHEFLFEHLRND